MDKHGIYFKYNKLNLITFITHTVRMLLLKKSLNLSQYRTRQVNVSVLDYCVSLKARHCWFDIGCGLPTGYVTYYTVKLLHCLQLSAEISSLQRLLVVCVCVGAAWYAMASHLAAQDYLARLQAAGMPFSGMPPDMPGFPIMSPHAQGQCLPHFTN